MRTSGYSRNKFFIKQHLNWLSVDSAEELDGFQPLFYSGWPGAGSIERIDIIYTFC